MHNHTQKQKLRVILPNYLVDNKQILKILIELKEKKKE